MRVPRYEHPVFAAQYDLSEGDGSHLGDREWYAERLTRTLAGGEGPRRSRGSRARLLEIGAGTGRITRHLLAALSPVRRGDADLVALDVGLPMLVRLGRVATGAPAVCADMTRLPLSAKTVTAAFSGYNVFGCLLEPTDLDACFAGIARVLVPRGRLLFDVAVHYAADHPEGPRQLDWQRWRDATGLEIQRRTTLHFRPGSRRLDLSYEFVWRAPGGAEERRVVPFALNTWPFSTYERALGAAGLEVLDRTERSASGTRGPGPTWVFAEAQKR